MAQFSSGVILDEVQNAPELMSYIQEIVDNNPEHGRFILTGSQNFLITEKVSQSLAGRTAILMLLSFTLQEIQSSEVDCSDVWEVIWRGGYPRIFDQQLSPSDWLANYKLTYLQRDVRQILNIGDLDRFSHFLKLAAAHSGQELNYSGHGGDIGVSHNTIRSWFSILQASYLSFSLPAWFPNIKKRIVKRPKHHFLDTGLLCYLLGIQSAEQLQLHPLRGAIFETWVTSEIYKGMLNQGLQPLLHHYRESSGIEFDLLFEKDGKLAPIEIKSSHTIASSFFKAFKLLDKREELQQYMGEGAIIYAGDQKQTRHNIRTIPWDSLTELF
ncbi:MAG: ATP-binding protein [Gammaproteobacteria bacterium]